MRRSAWMARRCSGGATTTRLQQGRPHVGVPLMLHSYPSVIITPTTSHTSNSCSVPNQREEHEEPLIDRAEALLNRSTCSMSDTEVVSLLEQLLAETTTTRQRHPALPHATNDTVSSSPPPSSNTKLMLDLLEHWLSGGGAAAGQLKTTRPFELCLQACRFHGDGRGASGVLDKWEHFLGDTIDLTPTLDAFHVTLDAFRRHSNLDEAVQMAMQVLDHMELTHALAPARLMTSVRTYALVMDVLCRRRQGGEGSNTSHSTQAPTELASMLQNNVIPLYEALDSPTPEDVYSIIQAHCCVASAESLHSLHKILMTRPSTLPFFYSDNVWTRANKYPISQFDEPLEDMLAAAYQVAMRRLLYTKDRAHPQQVAQQVEVLLSQLEQYTQYQPCLPNDQHYKFAMEAWCKVYDHKAPPPATTKTGKSTCPAERAEELLHRMEDRQSVSRTMTTDERDPSIPLIPLQLYESVLWAWTQERNAERAEALFAHVMDRLAQTPSSITCGPESVTTRCWNHIMTAVPEHRILDWWGRMRQSSAVPDGYTYTMVLKALSKQKTQPNVVARQADGLLREIRKRGVPHSAVHYGYVILAWARSSARNAAHRAMDLLHMMEERHAKTGRDDWKSSPVHYSAVINAWSRSNHPKATQYTDQFFQRMIRRSHEMDDFKVDLVAYSSMLNSYARRRTLEAAKQAESLLNQLEVQSAVDPNLRPNGHCYSSVISAWAKSGANDAHERAVSIFQKLEEAYKKTGDEALRPTVQNYSSLVGAWASSGLENAGDKADEIIESMNHRAATIKGAPRADKAVYTNAIVAHGRSGRLNAASKAEAILKIMKERYAQGDDEARPDVVAYTCTIQAIARSMSPGKAEKAWGLLRDMIIESEGGALEMRPNIVSFVALLNACSHTRGSEQEHREAVEIAVEGMQLLQEMNINTNARMFVALLEVFGRQVPEAKDRVKLTSQTFEQCCKAGQVDAGVIQTLRKFCPEVFRRLPVNEHNEISLPDSWSRNVND